MYIVMTYHGSCSHWRGRRFRPVIRCGPCGFVPIIGSIAVGIVQTLPASRQSRVRPDLGGHLKKSSKVNDKSALCTSSWLSVWILEAYCVCLAKDAGCKRELLTSGFLTHDSTLKRNARVSKIKRCSVSLLMCAPHFASHRRLVLSRRIYSLQLYTK